MPGAGKNILRSLAMWLGVTVLLASCSGGTSDLSTGAAGSSGTSEVVAWGDSTTSGIGASSGMSYPEQLQALTGRPVFNGGVSGQTSDQIAARQGGAPALLTFPGNSLPDAGAVVISAQSTFPVSAEGPGPIAGSVANIHGTLDFRLDNNSNPTLVFTRDAAGSPVTIPPQTAFIPDTFGREAKINVFWMGQNNFYETAQVKSDIAQCIALLTGEKFIVLSILNAETEIVGSDAYNVITQLNAELAQAYPQNYIDIRKILVNRYNPASPEDVRDYNNDTPPASLRSDNEHLNDQGYRIVAQQVAAFIAAKNWE